MPFETTTERELLRLASEGNQRAFETIFNRYKDKLYSFTLKLTASPEATQDIIQDTFLKLWRDRKSLTTIEHFSSYLFMMTRNQSVNALKRFARETLILSNLKLAESHTHHSPENILSLKEVRELLHESLEKLPPRQKLIFTLSRDHGLKHNEIAERLNLSSSTVKNHIIQAIRSLKEKLHYYPYSIVSLLIVFLF